MENLKSELTAAYDLLEKVPVCGGLVEVMANARQHLRNAYKILEEPAVKEDTDGR